MPYEERKNKQEEPKFKTSEQPPRPKSLRELYELVVNVSPGADHSEERFVDAMVAQLERDPIRTRSLKSVVVSKKLDLELPEYWPLNDFWHAAYSYLRSIDVQEDRINELES